MRRNYSRLTFITVIALALLCGCVSSVNTPLRVACVGDSITEGWGLMSPASQSYPAQLQSILGKSFSVENFGRAGATAQQRSDHTYWNTPQHQASLKSNPQRVVIMLGTNDSKPWNWNAAKFDADLRALIAQYQGLPTAPKVYVCLAPPVYAPNPFGNSFDPAFLQKELVPAIRRVASATGVTLIDNNTPLQDRPDFFFDGVHPSTEGAAVIARTVANALTARIP